MKTKKSLTNRFKITKTGKVLRRRSFTSHLKAKKSANRRRNLRGSVTMEGHFAKRIRKFMGVSLKDKSYQDKEQVSK